MNGEWIPDPRQKLCLHAKKTRKILRAISEKNRQLMIFRDFQESLLTRMYFKLAKKGNSGRPGELVFLHAVFRKQAYILFWPQHKNMLVLADDKMSVIFFGSAD